MRLRGLAAVAAVVLLGSPELAAQSAQHAPSLGIAVRYVEGTVHGFLELRTATGAFLASGDLLQIPRDGGIDSRMVFRFPDSSFFEESVSFTQQHVFALKSYHLVQRGPAFANDLDASLLASGRYVVKTKSHKDGTTKEYDGTLDMPADVSNGLVITLLKNIGQRDSQTVHLVAFTPQPRMISLQLAPSGTGNVISGKRTEAVVQFDLKPRLGALLGFFARLLGKMPPDSHVWIVTSDVPAFVRFEGPLYLGPIWRIDLIAPRWPQ